MTIQTTNIDATGGAIAVTLTTGDDSYFTIASGVIVQSETNFAISTDNTATFNIQNYGSIIADGDCVDLERAGDTFTNARGGSVIGGGDPAVYLGAQNQTVVNYGDISAGYAGIYDQVGGNRISNFGTIEAAGSTNVCIIAADGDHVFNSGTLSANDPNGVAISAGTQSTANPVTIDNKGQAEGYKYSVQVAGPEAVVLRNTGDLDGDVYLANTGGDTVTNQGKIEGKVTLGSGSSNTFDGRGGSVADGYIAGGTGADTVYLGNDGETVNSGAGHDTLYAGTGNDVFAYSSYASANSDTIFGFNVSNDLVQLNHAAFTKLTAGQTPAFTVGSAASSATDYLFYNSTSGGLYYDPDGNGSGAANLVAKLDPGLKMTAHDFKVI